MSPIEIESLRKEYGDTVAVSDLSVAVEPGEIFGFLGPNGAGKTTVIRTLLGFQSPTSGEAHVLGADATDEPALVEVKERVGYLPAHPTFDSGVTGRAFLDHQASLKGDERREELLALFDPPLDRQIRAYSTGNAQMLGLVTAFMHDPDLVILDEPTAGLDPLKQERFNEFLRNERERGTTVFFSSHVLGEVRRVCDRVGVLRDGELAAVEDVSDLLSRGGKRVRVRTTEGIAAGDVDLPGAVDIEELADGIRFTFTGDFNDLLDALGRFDIVELDVEEPPLEDVFMHFYGERGGEGSDSAEGEVRSDV
jgi:ABC-2 type transport system ATP-binding protein